MTLLEAKLEEARKLAQSALAQPEKSARSQKTQIIIGLRDDIAALKTRHWTWAQIATHFEPVLHASAETIRQVLLAHAKTLRKPKRPAEGVTKRAKRTRPSTEPVADQAQADYQKASAPQATSKGAFPSETDL